MIFVCVIKICFGGVYQVAMSQTKDSSCLRQIARRSGDTGGPLSPFSCYSSFSLGFTYNLGLGVFYICLYQNTHAIISTGVTSCQQRGATSSKVCHFSPCFSFSTVAKFPFFTCKVHGVVFYLQIFLHLLLLYS